MSHMDSSILMETPYLTRNQIKTKIFLNAWYSQEDKDIDYIENAATDVVSENEKDLD